LTSTPCSPTRWLAEDAALPGGVRIARQNAILRRREAAFLAADKFGGIVRLPVITTVVAITLSSAAIAPLAALPLTPFRYEAQAQRYCPTDKVVWLDFRKGTYYAKGQRLYGQGFDGSFVCRSEARSSGYRRALLGLR
jgi:hypothetical protein